MLRKVAPLYCDTAVEEFAGAGNDSKTVQMEDILNECLDI